MKKQFFGIMLILMFSTISLSGMKNSNTEKPTQSTVIRFFPQSTTVNVGETFTVACVVEDVSDFYGLDIQIRWNATLIDYVTHVLTMPCEYYALPIFPSPYAGTLHDPIIVLKNEVEPPDGYWCAVTTLGGPSFYGDGTCFIITFEALQPGTTTLSFSDHDLVDSVPDYIPHTVVEGDIEICAPPEINLAKLEGTSPSPYVQANYIRAHEPAAVTANITDSDGVAASFLSYRVPGGSWWNTTMNFNASSGLWTAIIPGQLANTTVEFLVTAYDNLQCEGTAGPFLYEVYYVIPGDIDGDGDVDIYDIIIACNHYGETYP